MVRKTICPLNFGLEIFVLSLTMSIHSIVWAQQDGNEMNSTNQEEKVINHASRNDSIYQKLFTTSNKWKLIQINGKMPASDSAFLILDQTTNTFSGNNGCNSMTGQFLVNGKITFSKIATTLMICENENNNTLEQEFSKLFDSPFEFDIADQTLNFYRQNEIVLMFGIIKH